MPDIDDIWDDEEDRAKFATPRALDRPTTSQHRAPQPAASVDREALVEFLRGCSFADEVEYPWMHAEKTADALLAAGWHNRPEAVVREEALAQAEATIAARDAEIARLRALLADWRGKISGPGVDMQTLLHRTDESLKEAEHD